MDPEEKNQPFGRNVAQTVETSIGDAIHVFSLRQASSALGLRSSQAPAICRRSAKSRSAELTTRMFDHAPSRTTDPPATAAATKARSALHHGGNTAATGSPMAEDGRRPSPAQPTKPTT